MADVGSAARDGTFRIQVANQISHIVWGVLLLGVLGNCIVRINDEIPAITLMPYREFPFFERRVLELMIGTFIVYKLLLAGWFREQVKRSAEFGDTPNFWNNFWGTLILLIPYIGFPYETRLYSDLWNKSVTATSGVSKNGTNWRIRIGAGIRILQLIFAYISPVAYVKAKSGSYWEIEKLMIFVAAIITLELIYVVLSVRIQSRIESMKRQKEAEFIELKLACPGCGEVPPRQPDAHCPLCGEMLPLTRSGASAQRQREPS